LVTERVGEIESGWARRRPRRPDDALEEALVRLGLLQRALRQRLLAERRRLRSIAPIRCARFRGARRDGGAAVGGKRAGPADQPLIRNSS
jgi:hypothetical protein